MLDCIIVIFSGLLGNHLEFGGYSLTGNFWRIFCGLLCSIPLYVACFHLFHTYQGVIRFSSYVDLYHIGLSVLIASAITGIIGTFFTTDTVIFPEFKSAFIIFGTSTFMMWVTRLLVKASFESFRSDNALPVAICGTQVGGIANSIRAVKDKQLYVRAFISDRKERAGMYIYGKPVFINGEGIAD